MTPTEWAAVIGCVIAFISAVYSAIRHMVKSILREFSPNAGMSLKDQVNRIEARLDLLLAEILKK